MKVNQFYPSIFETDKELKEAMFRIALLTDKHMGMDWRIKRELDQRAHVGGLSEQGTINHAIISDRLALESDINRRAIAAKRGLYWSATLQKFVSIPES